MAKKLSFLSWLVFWIYSFPLQSIKIIRKKSYRDTSRSYFPDLKSKSKFRIVMDQIRHLAKWRHPEENYFLYGLDIKGLRKPSDYLDYGYFMKRRDYLNNHPSNEKDNIYSYTGILRDKFYFAVFMEKLGFNVPKTFGLMDGEEVYLIQENQTKSLRDITIGYERHLICKPLDGLGGVGIFSLDMDGKGGIMVDGKDVSFSEFSGKMGTKRFFVQDRIMEQHPLMASLYQKAINTLRITTVRSLKTGNIELMGCMLLMGAREAIVSNWHYGGVIINEKEDGYLDKFGYSLYEKKITKHPETGVVFESFKVPFFEEALEQAKKCHRMFYGVHSIGWDFAVLPDGVMFIEGNDNWGMAAHQMVGGGLNAKFKQYYFK